VVYYVYAALKLTEPGKKVDFSVPTGNFGDIFAGFVARSLMPDRIRHLVLATNENDLLTRFVRDGEYSLGKVVRTCSPSMDIQLASNFERFLYYLYEEDADRTRNVMERFAESGSIRFSTEEQVTIRKNFKTKTVSEQETLETIRDFYEEYGYILDPHTAVGIGAAESIVDGKTPLVCLATAHPGKFGEAVEKAIGRPIDLPPGLAGLAEKESHCEVLDADAGLIRTFIQEHEV
jgi:threonine synthase